MEKYIAHIRNEDNKEQTVEDHLHETADLAEGFADDLFKPLARYAGIVHDIGKFRDGFQKRIRGLSSAPCEHACAAAQEINSRASDSRTFGMFAPMLEHCTAGHHAGLQNGMPTEISPMGSLQEALSRSIDDIDRSLYEEFCVPPDRKSVV